MRWIEEGRPAGACLAMGLLLSSIPANAQSPANPRPAPRFAVVIDAAHGGADSGARLSDHLLEKDLVLNLSVRLRSMLSAHGISVVTTRESDTAISALNRAETANHVGAAACITLHATTSGSGGWILPSFIPWCWNNCWVSLRKLSGSNGISAMCATPAKPWSRFGGARRTWRS